jgi:hypothetical protein
VGRKGWGTHGVVRDRNQWEESGPRGCHTGMGWSMHRFAVARVETYARFLVADGVRPGDQGGNFILPSNVRVGSL